MKISISLLKKWLNFDITLLNLLKQLKNLGFEIENIIYCKKKLSFINNFFIVGKIINKSYLLFKKKKIIIYKVKLNKNKIINVISSNDYITKFNNNNKNNNLLYKKVIIALYGAYLFNTIKIKIMKINNNIIEGVICTYYDLSIDNNLKSNIIKIYESNIKVGNYIKNYLDNNDIIINIHTINNRLDCQNILNIAKEIIYYNFKNSNTINKYIFKKKIKNNINDIFYYKINDNKFTFIHKIIKNINYDNLYTPLWLYEKLFFLDIPNINTIINIINFIFRNTGMIINIIDINYKKVNEYILKNNNIRIIDFNLYKNNIIPLYFNIKKKIFNLNNILLEIKFYNANYISINKSDFFNNKIKDFYYFLNNDYKLFIYVINNFLHILKQINNKILYIGPCIINNFQKSNLLNKKILLYKNTLKKKIGININDKKIIKFINNFNYKIINTKYIFIINVTKWRLDITIEINIISELLKIYNYYKLDIKSDNKNKYFIKNNFIILKNNLYELSENFIDKIKFYLINNGYYEVINYSFANPNIQNIYFSKNKNIDILYPLSKKISVLRQSLLFNLIENIINNVNYDNERLKLFEIGKCFYKYKNKFISINKIAIIITGYNFIKNWINKNNTIFNIYDLKSNIENILEIFNLNNNKINFKYKFYKFFNKKESLNIKFYKKKIGYLGKINKNLFNNNIKNDIFFAELNLDKILKFKTKKNIYIKPIYYHPIIKRDISLVIKNNINVNNILKTIKNKLKKYLINITIFDIYRGNPILNEYKNIGIRLELQNPTNKNSNLTDKQINKLIFTMIDYLKIKFQAYLRDKNYNTNL